MNDLDFPSWLAAELGALPDVIAVAFGGSRAGRTEGGDSDWDFAIY
jgi:hypothetical protein